MTTIKNPEMMEEISKAVSASITEIGLTEFKRTHMFLSSQLKEESEPKLLLEEDGIEGVV